MHVKRTPLFHGNSAVNNYRIAGNFRGIQFSRFSRLTGKPRKLNPRNKSLNAHSLYSDCPSSKIRLRNLSIQPFRENWIPRKFPAIRYDKFNTTTPTHLPMVFPVHFRLTSQTVYLSLSLSLSPPYTQTVEKIILRDREGV